MNTRKILTNGLLIGIIIVIIACVPDGFERVASWFFPPRLYIAIAAVIIARDDCSEESIYDVVSGIFNDVDGLSHAKKDELSLEFASSVTDVPYHAGAAKYFAEQGITVPTK